MARRTGSSSWSRPATGRQIAAPKAHGNYDGKYYSVGRASQTIGRSVRGTSGTSSPSRNSRGTRSSLDLTSTSLLADLLQVADDRRLVFSAVQDSALAGMDHDGWNAPVESVALTVVPDESVPAEPRVRLEAEVVRNSEHSGEARLEVRFLSNITFSDAPPIRATSRQAFVSGGTFDD